MNNQWVVFFLQKNYRSTYQKLKQGAVQKPEENIFINRIKSMGYALKGAILLAKNEPSIKIQLFIGLLFTILGFYYDISSSEWMSQTIVIGMVLSMEGANTSLEKIADFVHPDFHEKIGVIKDIAAGAVFMTTATAAVIACIIYIPKVFI